MEKDNNSVSIFVVLIIIVVLTCGTLLISASTLDKVQADSTYWKNRAITADAIIDSIFNNVPDSYIEDVLMETDLWEDYYILRYGED